MNKFPKFKEPTIYNKDCSWYEGARVSIETPEGTKGGTVIHDFAEDEVIAPIVKMNRQTHQREDVNINCGKGYYAVRIDKEINPMRIGFIILAIGFVFSVFILLVQFGVIKP